MNDNATNLPLSEERIQEIEARIAAARPGKWSFDYHERDRDGKPLRATMRYGDGSWMGYTYAENAPLYANAREDLAALIAEVRALRSTEQSYCQHGNVPQKCEYLHDEPFEAWAERSRLVEQRCLIQGMDPNPRLENAVFTKRTVEEAYYAGQRSATVQASGRVQITDEMVARAQRAYFGEPPANISEPRQWMRKALEAALNG